MDRVPWFIAYYQNQVTASGGVGVTDSAVHLDCDLKLLASQWFLCNTVGILTLPNPHAHVTPRCLCSARPRPWLSFGSGLLTLSTHRGAVKTHLTRNRQLLTRGPKGVPQKSQGSRICDHCTFTTCQTFGRRNECVEMDGSNCLFYLGSR
jgi:hypothetical protein